MAKEKSANSTPSHQSSAKASAKSPARPAGKEPRGAKASGFAEIDKLVSVPIERKKVEKAVDLLMARLEDDPDDVEALWHGARAWIRLLEHETGTVIEERPEYAPILAELGKKAMELASEAHTLSPKDADAVGWHMAAYGYYSISIGIIRAVLQGAAGKYLDLCDQLIKIQPGWLSGAAYRAQGRFYRQAPWPKRDIPRSIASFRKAIELGPKRLENKLQLGLALIDAGQKDEAIGYLREAAKGKPEESEAHFHAAVAAYAKQKLAELGA